MRVAFENAVADMLVWLFTAVNRRVDLVALISKWYMGMEALETA